jgi:hypothetical protein
MVGGVLLSLGYWFSDLAYDADLWLLGAALRVILVIALIGWGLSLITIVLSTIALLFVQVEE